MNTLGILLLATLPCIATWFAAKIHFESDAWEVLTEINNRHGRQISMVAERGYTTGYRDGKNGSPFEATFFDKLSNEKE